MSSTVIGRDAELEAMLTLCECQHRESPVLVLEGEPGIGKTTLLRAGVELAEEPARGSSGASRPARRRACPMPPSPIC